MGKQASKACEDEFKKSCSTAVASCKRIDVEWDDSADQQHHNLLSFWWLSSLQKNWGDDASATTEQLCKLYKNGRFVSILASASRPIDLESGFSELKWAIMKGKNERNDMEALVHEALRLLTKCTGLWGGAAKHRAKTRIVGSFEVKVAGIKTKITGVAHITLLLWKRCARLEDEQRARDEHVAGGERLESVLNSNAAFFKKQLLK